MGLDAPMKTLNCKNCGAVTNVPKDQLTVACDFCGSHNVNEEAHETRAIRPQAIAPFRVEKNKAIEAFRSWIGKGWFHPNDLKKVGDLDTLHAVYLPFWTYDAHTASSWSAMSGYHYYETETYTDSQGNRQTRQVQKTRWVPSSGYYEQFFDDVMVVASKGITQNRMERILPFELNRLVNYDPQYLLGKSAEVYALDVKEGFRVADGIMDEHIRREIVRRIPGDTYRDLSISTRKDGVTFKHILLPIWIAAYIYAGKSFQVIVNGQTGKISGEKPLSAWKITLTILFALVVIVGGYFLYQKYR
jgi:hypothetical protein